MTEEEKDMDLGNLFRNKLEENEMAADSDLTGRFMRRLDRKEFFRFNPARFNIYYLAAAAAGLTIAGLLIFTSPRNGDEALGYQTPQPEITDYGNFRLRGLISQRLVPVTGRSKDQQSCNCQARSSSGKIIDIEAGGIEPEELLPVKTAHKASCQVAICRHLILFQLIAEEIPEVHIFFLFSHSLSVIYSFKFCQVIKFLPEYCPGPAIL